MQRRSHVEPTINTSRESSLGKSGKAPGDRQWTDIGGRQKMHGANVGTAPSVGNSAFK